MAGTPLCGFLDLLRSSRIVLASGSPRRKQILAQIGLSFDVVESNFPEDLDKLQFATAADYAVENGRKKGTEALLQMGFKPLDESYKQTTTARFELQINNNAAVLPWLLIACDTVVVADLGDDSAAGKARPAILEKPVDADNAFAMMKMLNGCWHHVISGVWLALRMHSTLPASIPPTTNQKVLYRQISFNETTRVKFSALSDAVMRSYVSNGEGFGKAGGYGIQGLGASLIESIDGDFYNVMGFPLNRFCRELVRLLEECGYDNSNFRDRET